MAEVIDGSEVIIAERKTTLKAFQTKIDWNAWKLFSPIPDVSR